MMQSSRSYTFKAVLLNIERDLFVRNTASVVIFLNVIGNLPFTHLLGCIVLRPSYNFVPYKDTYTNLFSFRV